LIYLGVSIIRQRVSDSDGQKDATAGTVMDGSYGGTYLVVLLIGVAIVIADGQLIMRHSPSYLVEAYRDPRDPNPTVPAVLRRLGTLLILTAIGHAATMLVLSRLREQQTGTELANAQMDAPPAAAPAAVTGPDGVTRTPTEPDANLSVSGAARRGLVAGRGRAARRR
jgi:hypothetical protein